MLSEGLQDRSKDINGALNFAMNNLEWSPNGVKVVLHIANDASHTAKLEDEVES